MKRSVVHDNMRRLAGPGLRSDLVRDDGRRLSSRRIHNRSRDSVKSNRHAGIR
jgi:hypothetical protein